MKELDVLKKVVKESGEAILEMYNQNVGIEYKEDKSPVTEADLKSEEIIYEGLKGFGYGFLSEELVDDQSRLEQERVWIVDPLDGTKDFIQKTGDFTVLVALVENGAPILGVVYQPVKKRMFFAEKGGGAFAERDGEVVQIQVSDRGDFSAVKMLVSRNHLLKLEKGLAESLGIRNLVTCGSAGLKMGLVSSGKADLYINSSDKTSEWDICAGEVILREAGGQISDLNGQKIVYNKKDVRNYDGYMVTNGIIHQKVEAEVKVHQG